MQQKIRPALSAVLSSLWLCGTLLLGGCEGFGRLDPPGPGQALVVGLPADPVFQQVAPHSEGLDGISRDLAKAFADELGVALQPVVVANPERLREMLRTGRIHLAAPLPVDDKTPGLTFSTPLHETRQLIVQHDSALPVTEPARLASREILVLAGSPQEAALRSLTIEPPPTIVTRQGIDPLPLLGQVAKNRHLLAATDEMHFDVATNFYPDLALAFALPEPVRYAWAVAGDNTELRGRIDRFVARVKTDGTLRRLNDRYFGHVKRLDGRDIEVFLEHLRERLPRFRQAFHEAQEITGIDWRLLAALAYQESQWDPLATSPTGVRGMMMLTEETADRLGVANRLDAPESIRAGARYLAQLMDALPDSIKPPDRLWFALAAYNLGMGHLNGGRHFAPGLKRDPDHWADMKEVLPLLARPEYYERLKSGRARGGEAVIMVENIRNYFDVLVRLEPIHTPPSLGAPPPKTPRRLAAKTAQRAKASTSSPPM